MSCEAIAEVKECSRRSEAHRARSRVGMVNVSRVDGSIGSEKKDIKMPTGDTLMLQQFASELVREAFRQRATGSNMRFEDLRRGFATKVTAPDAPSALQLQYLLVALTKQISLLDINSITLVKTIIAINWLGRSWQFVEIYTRFLVSLVSSHAEFSSLVIRMLVQHMNLLHHSTGRIPHHAEVCRDEIHTRVHSAMQHVLDVVPFARENIVPIIISEFPHKSEKVLAQTVYIKNLLRMTRYEPSIEGATLGVIIDKIISIDVEIQVDLDDLVSDDGDVLADGMDSDIDDDDDVETDLVRKEELHEFATEMEELIYDDEDSVNGNSPNATVQLINENINKLDSVLAILFEHLEQTFSNLPAFPERTSARSRFVVAETTFEALLFALDQTILKTYQSRYTQFILFWAAQMHREFTDSFLGVILERALDHARPSTHRMIAASYIGSFTARASTLDRAHIRMLTSMLVGWINGFLDAKEGDLKHSRDAVKRFGVFYAIVQALFYVFCFRWRELSGLNDIEADEVSGPGNLWLPGLQRTIERAIYHRTLNPLKYCNASIITQFAKVSHHLDFVFCGTIIEANKRTSQSGVGEIDSYFPFDPYELKRSRHFVDKFYASWTPLVDDDVDDSDSDSEMS